MGPDGSHESHGSQMRPGLPLRATKLTPDSLYVPVRQQPDSEKLHPKYEERYIRFGLGQDEPEDETSRVAWSP